MGRLSAARPARTAVTRHICAPARPKPLPAAERPVVQETIALGAAWLAGYKAILLRRLLQAL
jgi:hypothetical protein